MGSIPPVRKDHIEHTVHERRIQLIVEKPIGRLAYQPVVIFRIKYKLREPRTLTIP